MDPLEPARAPSLLPDRSAEPEAFVVVVGPDRLHFLDWGGPGGAAGAEGAAEMPAGRPGVLLVHGLASTAWSWTPVARRLRAVAHVVAMDLRGHGLSDSPTEGYDPDGLAEDVEAVAEGSGLLGSGSDGSPTALILAGHGFGGVVAAWAAARLGDRCAGLVLVDGGWTDLAAETGMEPDEWLRAIEEPPEVLRSMAAFLADRAGFDPASWDPDAERAARASVVEVPAGHLVPAIRPHALARSVEALFAYRPATVLPSIEAPIVALVSSDPEGREALPAAQAALVAAGRSPARVVDLGPAGHNLLRYRPDAVSGAIAELAAATMKR
jgi:pimeloyl-ACP methyl ester carboxylesterase